MNCFRNYLVKYVFASKVVFMKIVLELLLLNVYNWLIKHGHWLKDSPNILLISSVKKDKIPVNEGAKSWVQKVLLQLRVQKLDKWGHSENEGAKKWAENVYFFMKLIVDFNALFELYLAIIYSGFINSLQILHEKLKFIICFIYGM